MKEYQKQFKTNMTDELKQKMEEYQKNYLEAKNESNV